MDEHEDIPVTLCHLADVHEDVVHVKPSETILELSIKVDNYFFSAYKRWPEDELTSRSALYYDGRLINSFVDRFNTSRLSSQNPTPESSRLIGNFKAVNGSSCMATCPSRKSSLIAQHARSALRT